MSSNIKNEEAHRLARELAECTGESMATAVTRAVRERLERVRRARRMSKVERILKIAREYASVEGTVSFCRPWRLVV